MSLYLTEAQHGCPLSRARGWGAVEEEGSSPSQRRELPWPQAVSPHSSPGAAEWSSGKDLTRARSNEAHLPFPMAVIQVPLSRILVPHPTPLRERKSHQTVVSKNVLKSVGFFPLLLESRDVFLRTNRYAPSILFLFGIAIKRNCWGYKL